MSAYEGASRAQRTSSWSAPSSGPNRALSTALPVLRDRSRAAYRNNPLIKKALGSLVSSTIGTGIKPGILESIGDSLGLKRAWKQGQPYIDADGLSDFYGLQTQIDLAARLSGEVFILRISEQTRVGGIPLQIQLLESEFVPIEMNKKLQNGNEIRAGIEFSGRTRVAYHMYTDHPQEEGAGFGKTIRVPAEEVIHFYKQSRPGQLRGEPDASQSLLKAYTFDSYDHAELQRKETRAPYTGSIEKDFPPDFDGNRSDSSQPQDDSDSSEPSPIQITGGSLIELFTGEKLNLFDGDKSGDGYKDFMRMQMLLIAAGFKLPYELMTGDWENVNDRLVRAILNDFHRMLRAEQAHFAHSVCRCVWGWWLDAGVVSGNLALPNYSEQRDRYTSMRWIPDRWAYVNPVQDVKAAADEIKYGLESRDEKIFQRGRTPSEVDEEQAEGNRRREALTKGEENEEMV